MELVHVASQLDPCHHGAVEELVRAAALADGHEPLLKHSRWVLLKRPENLTENQTAKLKELLRYNLKTVRAYLLREEFQRFWEYRSAYWAGRFLRDWCAKAMRSR